MNAEASVTFVNSNYSTLSPIGSGSSVTSPTTPGNGNQTASPILANPNAGDFHPLSGSPTIDAGTTDTFVGDLDLDRQARALNGVPDIGAYEFDNVAPDTQITSGPSGLTTSAIATFTFASDDPTANFQCSVDSSPFAGCSGPGAAHTTPALAEGAHTFAVRAVDPAGNVDASPASRSFTVNTAPPPDLAAPSLIKLRVSPARFRATGPRKGTTISYSISEPANVAFRFARGRTGRRSSRGHCVKTRRSNESARRCTFYAPLTGTLHRAHSTAGAKKVRFAGRLGGKVLKPGRYKLIATATDKAGNKSAAKTARFTVLAPRG